MDLSWVIERMMAMPIPERKKLMMRVHREAVWEYADSRPYLYDEANTELDTATRMGKEPTLIMHTEEIAGDTGSITTRIILVVTNEYISGRNHHGKMCGIDSTWLLRHFKIQNLL